MGPLTKLKQLMAKASSRKNCVGIELLPEGLAVAVHRPLDNREDETTGLMRPGVAQTRILLRDAEANLAAMLNDWVAAEGLEGSPCNLVLNSSDYQLLLVEAPDVPETELREAVRWRVKDLISMPVEAAAMDVFLLPADGSRGGKKMAYVVVSELDKIKSVAELVNNSGLVLDSIDIGELALRNLAYLKELGNPEGHGVAIVRLLEGNGTVSLYRRGNMYLSRRFKIAYGGGLLDDIPLDSFILEAQRSLDYYERQMGQQPPSVLYLCGENISEDKITLDVARGLSVPVKYLNLESALSAADNVEENLLHVCVAAVGGALRLPVTELRQQAAQGG